MRLKGFVALLGGYGALRLLELAVSRRHERRLGARGVPRHRDRAFPWMVAAHVAPLALAPVEAALLPRRSRALTAAAIAALAAAGAVRLWVVRTLGERWNVRIRGGPAMAVATGGPYRFVRHPNYAAVLVEVAALPLAGGALRTALLATALNAFAIHVRILDEESVLSQLPAWRQAMSNKPLLFPRLTLRRRRRRRRRRRNHPCPPGTNPLQPIPNG